MAERIEAVQVAAGGQDRRVAHQVAARRRADEAPVERARCAVSWSVASSRRWCGKLGRARPGIGPRSAGLPQHLPSRVAGRHQRPTRRAEPGRRPSEPSAMAVRCRAARRRRRPADRTCSHRDQRVLRARAPCASSRSTAASAHRQAGVAQSGRRQRARARQPAPAAAWPATSVRLVRRQGPARQRSMTPSDQALVQAGLGDRRRQVADQRGRGTALGDRAPRTGCSTA